MVEEELRPEEMAFLNSIFSSADRVLPDFDPSTILHRRPHLFATGLVAVYLPHRGWLYEFPFDLHAAFEINWSEPVRRVPFAGGARELFADRCSSFAILAPEDDGSRD